jgi:nitrite reductase/ring-hydroxylating ferredoxin subunit
MLNRRSFFTRLAAAAGGAALAWLALPARAWAKKMAFGLDKAEALKKVGGQALIKLKDKEILFVRDGEASVRAFDPVCPHEKCKVAYDDPSKMVVCPCHKSSFELATGKVLSGPSPKGLTTYPAELSGEKIIVTLE